MDAIGWDILRTKPRGRCRGRAVPTFIHNGSFFLSTVDVSADGAIDCWGFVDRALFREKVANGWVDPRPPAGCDVSIHSLGGGELVEGRWAWSRDDVLAHADAVVRRLNPALRDLVDMHGSATELRNGLRYAKLGLANERPYRFEASGAEVPGGEVPVLVRDPDDRDAYRLTRWFVYADGLVQLGYGTPLLPARAVGESLEAGAWQTSAPDGSWIDVEGLGRARLREGFWHVDARERVRECLDLIRAAAGEPGAVERCRTAFAQYESDPTPARRETLRAAYEAVPEHLRLYCGDMDSKDWPIRRVLYPNDLQDAAGD